MSTNLDSARAGDWALDVGWVGCAPPRRHPSGQGVRPPRLCRFAVADHRSPAGDAFIGPLELLAEA
jgi:hypothetical protein